MTSVVLTLLLHAAPTLELSASSDCAAELREAFRESEFPLAAEGEVELTLTHGAGNELIARRDDAVALRRELGPGTCGEASRAAVVIVGRWLTSLPASTWKGPKKRSVKLDAGASAVSPPPAPVGEGRGEGKSDAGAASSRDGGARDGAPTNSRDGGARDGASMTSRDGGARDGASTASRDGVLSTSRDGGARDGASPTSRDGVSSTSSRDGASATSRDGGARDGASATSRDGGARDGASATSRDGGARDGTSSTSRDSARDGSSAASLDGGVREGAWATSRDGGASAGEAGSGGSLTPTPLPEGEGGTSSISGVRIESTGAGFTGDAGTARIGKLIIDAGTEPPPEAVIGRIGVAPPLVTLPIDPPTPTAPPLRIEVTHAEALAGGGLATPGVVDALSPALSLDLALVFNKRIRIGALGTFDFGGSTNVLDERSQIRGRLTSRAILTAPTAMFCFDTAVRLCGGVLAGARITEGDASGQFIFQQAVQWKAAFTLGPTLQAALILGRFHLALDAALLVTPTPSSFSVVGLPTTLSWPVAQGLFRLSIGVGSL
ncbi:MAG: hypothetical protein JNM17_23590 [Archangium sp.]|nr:hypothetical protein [Archangium sp.]